MDAPAAEIVAPPDEWLKDPRRPPVVIAIPHWNKSALLVACVESLLQVTTYPHVRICVFDQGSTDDSRVYLHGWGDRVDTILSPENVGFILANNAIIERYRDWDVLMLNNDTTLDQPDWLDVLVAAAYSANDIGIVGPKLVYPDGRLQEAGSQLFRNGSARAYGKFDDPDDPRFNSRRDVDFCSAACIYVKRALLDQCGGFDERYRPCYYEDADLALKGRAAGFRTVFEPGAAVVHHEYGTSGKAGATELMIRNAGVFAERWRELLQTQPHSLWELPPRSGRSRVVVIGAPGASTAQSQRLVERLAREHQVAYVHPAPLPAEQRLQVKADADVAVFYPGYARAVGSDALDLGAILLHNDPAWVIFEDDESRHNWLGLAREYARHARLAIADGKASPQQFPAREIGAPTPDPGEAQPSGVMSRLKRLFGR